MRTIMMITRSVMNTDQWNCSACGTANSENATTCQGCGTKDG